MTARRPGAVVVRLVRLAAAVAITAGLFGMHVLAHHGATHEPIARADSALMSMSADAGDAHATATSPDRDAMAGGGAHGTGHGLAGMVMMCVAVLAAAITLLGLLVLVRVGLRWWALPRLTLTRLRPVRWNPPAGTGPPPAWRFSVVRC